MDFMLIQQAVSIGDAERVRELTELALQEKIDPQRIIDQGYNPAMAEVGLRMKTGEMFVPEVLLASRAMQAGLAVLEPILTKDSVKNIGTMVIGTVHGDLHDIGKNLVAILLKSIGLKIVDLGKNVPAERFVEAVKENQADLLGMSALLTTTMPSMEKTITVLKEAGLREKVKVIVGGAPLTQQYANDIGADAYAPSAGEAIEVVKGLLGLG